MTPDIVVTGIGAITPIGDGAAATWAALLEQRTATRLITDEWAADLPVQIAAPVDVDVDERSADAGFRGRDRSTSMALVAAAEAWADAGLSDVDHERLAVCLGTGIGGIQTILAQDRAMRERGPRRVSAFTVPAIMPNGPAAAVGLAYGAQAGVHAPVSACASGAEAIALALDMLRAGRADVVITGGTEAAVARLPLAAFAAMRALSSRSDSPEAASRPFDKQRDGFVLGEGAGVMILETAEHAAARGARVRGRLLGAGMTNDAHHVAAPEPQGRGAARAMTLAMRDAGITPAELDHVNAHATSTPLGDLAEASALQAVLGAAVDDVAVTATKSCTGHLLGAAGAAEAIITLQSLADGKVPAIRNLDDPADEIGLDLVRITPRPVRRKVALSNSFGFGGHNVALVFGAA